MLQTTITAYYADEEQDIPFETVVLRGAVSFQEAQDVVEKWLRLGAVTIKSGPAPDGSVAISYTPMTQVQELRVRVESIDAPEVPT